MAHKSDAELIATTHNTARFFTENRHIAWVTLIAVVIWGIYGYARMPKRKDPDIPIREAQAICPWPGVAAEKVEQLVTRRIEEKVAESTYLNMPGGGSTYGIRSTTLDGLSIVNVQLQEGLPDTKKIFSDIDLKLISINNELPKGAGPIQFYSDFGDTAALMLTVASPRESEVAISIRAREISRAIQQARAKLPPAAAASRYTIVWAFPRAANAASVKRIGGDIAAGLEASAGVTDVVAFQGPGFVGFDAGAASAKALSSAAEKFILQRFGTALWDPDLWEPIVVHDPAETEGALLAVAGDKYTYRELDDFTALLERGLASAAQVSKVTRKGVYAEQIALDYSQNRLAAYGITPNQIAQALAARNVTMEGGTLEVGHAQLVVHPSGDFRTPEEIGDVMIARSASGSPVYLRDLVDISRSYISPPQAAQLVHLARSAGTLADGSRDNARGRDARGRADRRVWNRGRSRARRCCASRYPKT